MNPLPPCPIPLLKLVKCADYSLLRKTQGSVRLEDRLEIDEQNTMKRILDFILHTAENNFKQGNHMHCLAF